MAYIHLALQGHIAREEAQKLPPFGPGIRSEDAARVHAMVVYCSSVADSGGDWVRFLVVDHNGQLLADIRTDGY